MSEILVNKLTGTSTAGSILVTGEGNSTTTNLQQGLNKSWMLLDPTTTSTIKNSLNVTSYTDNSSGNMTMNITNAYSNDDFTVSGSLGNSNNSASASLTMIRGYNWATTSFKFTSLYAANGGTLAEWEDSSVNTFGDLA